ncbi:MAG TPA: DinB family protein [Anaerolineae bacterium]|nr:DinB family protein [Anaerolineae bacterium]
MNIDHLTSQMAKDAVGIRALVQGISEHQARWRPAPDSWSILEVVNHLLDEEREDFRVRLEVTLQRPGEPWPPIDPQGWVAQRKYNEQDLEPSLTEFLSEREASLGWLRGLSVPNWQATYESPFGPISAGDLFASWVAHDLLHMRQLVELHWAYTTSALEPYSVDYAGAW